MAGQKGKIFVNTNLDFKVLKIVIKRNWYWCALIFLLLIVSAFLYLRYTKPVFESNMLIQINSEDQGADVLGFKGVQKDNSIAKEVELLRSQMLFEQAVADLPLDISYYSKGEFLTETLYKRSIFKVQLLHIENKAILGIPIYVYPNKDEIGVKFTFRGEKHSYSIAPNSTLKTPFFTIKIQIKKWKDFKSRASSNELYFRLNNLTSLANQLRPALNVIQVDRNASTVGISFQSENALLAKEIIQSLVNNFLKYDEDIKKESADNILEFIAVQLDSLKKELITSKDSIMYFQRQENITNPEKMTSSMADKIEALKINEKKVIEELNVLKNIKNKLAGNPNSIDVYRLIPIIIGQSYASNLDQQIQSLYDLIEEKEDLLYQVTPQNEEVQKLEMRIQVHKDNINNVIELLTSRVEEKLKLIREDLKKYEKDFFVLPEKQMELSRLQKIKELNEKYFSLLTDKKAIYSISNAGYASDNKVLNDAYVPRSPVSPKKEMIYGMTLFFSFSLSVAFLLLRYLTFNEINQMSDLKSLIPSNVGVLGSIPLAKTKTSHSTLIVDDNPHSVISEAFRTLRTNLSFVKNNTQTITITSTVSGEGKTFVVLNLAGILAMSGKKVLVVDLDMRRPVVHLGLGATNEKGMSNLLADLCQKEDVIQKTRVKKLDFIPAGPIPPNPSELLLSDHFDNLIASFKQDYDIVIFDNPPVGLISDGVQLLGKVDVPIYVFRSNYSKRNYADKLHEIAEIKGLTNINVVLNGIDVKGSAYGYGSYFSDN